MKKVISTLAALAVAATGMSLSAFAYGFGDDVAHNCGEVETIGALTINGTTTGSITNGEDQQCMKFEDEENPSYWLNAYTIDMEAGNAYAFDFSTSTEDTINGSVNFVLYDQEGTFEDNYYFAPRCTVNSGACEASFTCIEDATYVLYIAADFNSEDVEAVSTLDYSITTTKTEIEVREVSTAQELVAAANDYNAAESDEERFNIKLMADIDMTNVEFTPFEYFTNIFGGNGYKISNLNIDGADRYGLGFFNETEDSNVVNLNLENVSITGADDVDRVGLMVGQSYDSSYFYNCSVSGTISSNGSVFVGGFAGGSTYSTYENCSADSAITSEGYLCDYGGFVGGSWSGNAFVNSFATGSLDAESGEFVGGFAGYSRESQFLNSYSLVDMTVEAVEYFGGFVGAPQQDVFSNCYANNTLTFTSLTTTEAEREPASDPFVGCEDAYNDTSDSSTYVNCFGNVANISETSTEYEIFEIGTVDFTDDEAIAALNTSLDTFVEEYEGEYTLKTWVVDADLNTPVFSQYFVVTFLNKDGEVIGEQEVEIYSDATAPEAPEVEGFKFTGWDVDFTNVTSDLTVTAQYEEIPEEPKPEDSSATEENPKTGSAFAGLAVLALAGAGFVVAKKKS